MSKFKYPVLKLVEVYEDMQYMMELKRKDLQILEATQIEFKPDEQTGTLMFMKKHFNTSNWRILALQMRCCGRMPAEITSVCQELGMKTKKGLIKKNDINVYLNKWKEFFTDAGHRYPTVPTSEQLEAFDRFNKENIQYRSRKEMGMYDSLAPSGELPMTKKEKNAKWQKRVKKSKEKVKDSVLMASDIKLLKKLRRP